jgi:Concanavalin A-like lectin/glucanases superfamily
MTAERVSFTKFLYILYTNKNICSAVQVDYDMYFPEPERSSATLVVPFRTSAPQSLTAAMWVKYAQRDEGGVFFTMYGVSSPHVPTERRVMLQAHSSGVQVSLFKELPDAFLSFKEYATINDGQWHHIAVVWDGSVGTLTLITEGLIASKLENYGAGRHLTEK